MKATILIISLFSLRGSLFSQDTTYNAVIQQLFKIDELDQRYRNQIGYIETKYGRGSKEIQVLFKNMDDTDSINLVQVKAIIEKYGWLGYNEIGSQANTAIFMVIQHSDQATQEKYLPMMREAVKNGKAKPGSLALLEDRVALKQGRMQNYGSQILWSNAGSKYFVLPLDDPDNVDKRRAIVGLQPLSEYVRTWNIKWDVEQYKKDLPAIVAECKIYFQNCCSKF
ncbi:MAG TPA: DUF6624 domain-containing protein [Ferruginibacter sp.]|nr:DUF6624 domain-containing protein [Ferruginibacter sp.]